MFPFSDASVHHRTFPYVNAGLIAVSVLVFLYEMTVGGLGVLTGGGGGVDLDVFFFKWGFIASTPERLFFGKSGRIQVCYTGFDVIVIIGAHFPSRWAACQP